MIYLDGLNDFNKLIEYYKVFLKYIQEHCNSIVRYENSSENENMYKILEDTVLALRNVLNLGTLYISKFEEESSVSSEINSFLEKIPSFKYIECIGEENYDKKKQLRNCFGHADYRICIEDIEAIPQYRNGYYYPLISTDSCYLEINNGKIKGKITYEDFISIMLKYNEIAITENKAVRHILMPQNSRFCNSSNLNTFVDELECLKTNFSRDKNVSKDIMMKNFDAIASYYSNFGSSKEDYEATMNYMLRRYHLFGDNCVEINETEIPKSEKDFFKSYIKYLGIGVWDNKLNNLQRQEIIKDIFNLQDGKYNNIINTIVFSNMFSSFFDQFKVEELSDKLGYLFFEGPFIYTDVLLGYANYCFDYVREVNQNRKNEGKELFEFKNIDLSGINPIYSDSKEKKEKTKVHIDKNLVFHKKEEEESLYRIVPQLVTKIDFMNSRNRNPEKIKKLESINLELEKINVNEVISSIARKIMIEEPIDTELSEAIIIDSINTLLNEYDQMIPQQKNIYSKFKDTVEKYTKRGNLDYPIEDLSLNLQEINAEIDRTQIIYADSSNFFRHMRNSIAHGRYVVDYEKALRKKDFSAIVIFFEDFDKEKNVTTFKVKITGNRLLKLLNDFQQSVNRDLKENKNEGEFKNQEYITFLQSIQLDGLSIESELTDEQKKHIEQIPSFEKKIQVINKLIKEEYIKRKVELEERSRPTNEDFEKVVDEKILVRAMGNREITEDMLSSRDRSGIDFKGEVGEK